jgi:hypothetical protein
LSSLRKRQSALQAQSLEPQRVLGVVLARAAVRDVRQRLKCIIVSFGKPAIDQSPLRGPLRRRDAPISGLQERLLFGAGCFASCAPSTLRLQTSPRSCSARPSGGRPGWLGCRHRAAGISSLWRGELVEASIPLTSERPGRCSTSWSKSARSTNCWLSNLLKAMLIGFELASRPAKRNCKLGVCHRSVKQLIYRIQSEWVPNEPSERPQRKPGVRERFRASAVSSRCTAVREERPNSWAFQG